MKEECSKKVLEGVDEESLYGIDKQIRWYVGSKKDFLQCVLEKRKKDNPLRICDAMCPLHGGFLALMFMLDAVGIVHGPAGCSVTRQVHQYAIEALVPGLGAKNPYTACTNLTEQDIVMGGEEKLARAIQYVDRELKPNLIGILNTCVSGIIGDDIDAVAESLQPEVNAQILPVHCEGFASIGQGHGYSTLYTELVRHVMRETHEKIPNSVNIFGHFRAGTIPGADNLELKGLLAKCGIHTNAVITADSTVEEIRNAPRADLNLIRCQDIGLNAAKEMNRIFGTPYVSKFSPMGIEATRNWVMSAAEILGLEKQAEKVLAGEVDRVYKVIKPFLDIIKGKRVAVVAGPTRALWTARFLNELGMEVIFVGATNYKEDYPIALERTLEDIKDQVLVGIGPNVYEMEVLFSDLKPDLYISDVAEQKAASILGIPTLFIHTSGYFGLEGAARFVRDVHNQLKNPLSRRCAQVWRNVPRVKLDEKVRKVISEDWSMG